MVVGYVQSGKTANFTSLIAKAENAGRKGTLEVWGDGSAVRDFIHAHDVARGMIFTMEKKLE